MDLGGNDIELTTLKWAKHREDLLVRYFSTVLFECENPAEKQIAIKQMRNIHGMFHSMRKALAKAGIEDGYEGFVVIAGDIIKNQKSDLVHVGGTHEELTQ